MAYLNGFFYKVPLVGKRYIFIDATDLWRGSYDVAINSPEDDLEYMFPERRATGIITKVQKFKASQHRMGYRLWIRWDGEPLREPCFPDEWYFHACFVTLAPEEVPKFLRETQKVCLSPLAKALAVRKKAFDEFSLEVIRESVSKPAREGT